jgi:acyl-CoA synthetase (AMP-forming)/AMP-acid ligase II
MRGQMMDMPLTTTEIARHTTRHHGRVEVVSVTADMPRHRSTYAEVFARANRVAGALQGMGLEPGDRVATLAWNDHRHLELYYGVSGAGYVLHTVNPRLFPEQLAYIINHAEDRVLCFDIAFLPLVEALAEKLPSVEHYIVLTSAEHMPKTTLAPVHCYERWLEVQKGDFVWPELDEHSASALCYTSGTTGNPKGVLYSHRATLLHAMACCMPNAICLSRNDTVLPVVPMFHVNAWGIPYVAPMAGAKLVLPGPKMGDGATLQALIEAEQVTVALGVPTVWMALLKYLRESGKRVPSLERTVVGGAACPLSIMKEFESKHGVYTHHAWGMTEMSPLGTLNCTPKDAAALSEQERDALRLKQGQAVFGVDMKVVGADGAELPWDGESSGDLRVRGWWVCDSYFRDTSGVASHDAEGWFTTGDVANIDAEGFLNITDRSKDVIKSGGEWISSIALESIVSAHPAVAEAAVIGVAHEKWSERPLLVVVLQPDAKVETFQLRDWFKGKVAEWWIPDAIEFIAEIPHTATGKVSKLELRRRFAGYTFPDASSS